MLITLPDAANFITKLPKSEHDAPERQAARSWKASCQTRPEGRADAAGTPRSRWPAASNESAGPKPVARSIFMPAHSSGDGSRSGRGGRPSQMMTQAVFLKTEARLQHNWSSRGAHCAKNDNQRARLISTGLVLVGVGQSTQHRSKTALARNCCWRLLRIS